MTDYSRRKALELIGVSGLALAGAGTVAAAPKPARNMRTHLTGDEVVPAVDTKAHGQAKFKLSKDESELAFKLNVANIEDVAAAHIHHGAPGVNGPVVVGLYTGGVIPGRTQGTLAEGVITDADVGGMLSTLVDAMRNGATYVQVHTMANPGGEIRGQID